MHVGPIVQILYITDVTGIKFIIIISLYKLAHMTYILMTSTIHGLYRALSDCKYNDDIASVVQWQNTRLPRGWPGFDSRLMHDFIIMNTVILMS